jgi:hypothetical protein
MQNEGPTKIVERLESLLYRATSIMKKRVEDRECQN